MKPSPMRGRVVPLRRNQGLANVVPLVRTPAAARVVPLRSRSPKMAKVYREQRVPLVRELFAELSICEVPSCTRRATDPHEPLTRARGGDILDPGNVRKVCHYHNWLFGAREEPWMYEQGFLTHSWKDDGGDAA